jgi:hypothetical protein
MSFKSENFNNDLDYISTDAPSEFQRYGGTVAEYKQLKSMAAADAIFSDNILTIPITRGNDGVSPDIEVNPFMDTVRDQFTSGDIWRNAYKGLDDGLQLGSGAAQLSLGRAMAWSGALIGNKTTMVGGAYLLTAGVANIQGAGNKYFNIAVGEDYLSTTNFLQSTYESTAKAIGLDSSVGTVVYNVAELGTAIYGELKPTLVSDTWDYGLAITGAKYTMPILQETAAILSNTAVGFGKGVYDIYTSTLDVINKKIDAPAHGSAKDNR